MEMTFTLRNVLLGSSLLGVICGILGTFALLRRQSLLGDALAHAALPGVCIAFLIAGTKDPLVLLAGALASGTLGALIILGVVRWSRIKEDSAIGIVLSVFFGLGIVLLTRIQKLPGGNQSGLDRYLFGQAATLVTHDIVVMAVLGGLALVAVALFFKEFKLLAFDRAFGASMGFPMRALEIGLTCLLVVVVMVGLQTVGVVLMVATLITPAAAARQWTDRLGVMAILSGAIGGLAGAAGSLVSASVGRLPTGPSIVIVSSLVLVVSLLFAPRRGMVWAWRRERLVRERIRSENLLKDLYRVGEEGERWSDFASRPALMGLRGQSGYEFARFVQPLIREGLVESSGDDLRLTERGLEEAERVVRKHRLWEVYLARRLELPADHLHRDAEAMEHALTEEAVDEIERRFDYPEVDPHGQRIPRRRDAR
jgi:manganese/zinc/iron transport system permease protein